MNQTKMWCVTAAAAACVLWSAEAAASCGCFMQPLPVPGQTATDLYTDATQVALVRDGTRTVLTMQNNYRGPVKDFALVIPVPEVLQEDEVAVVDPAIFARLDAMTSPRLYELEEQDPCPDLNGPNLTGGLGANDSGVAVSANDPSGGFGEGGGVVVEAEFDVDAYQIVILSADDSAGLLTWLTENGYDVPSETADVLQGYIAQGMYFFVAKVDPSKVAFEDGEAVLPPLRFEYDSTEFSLPVRLGTVNSPGTQDVIAYVLSDEGRFEASNYTQITMPTNLEVSGEVRDDFGGFYRALYDEAAQGETMFSATEFSVRSPTNCWGCGLWQFENSYGTDYAALAGAREGERFDGWWDSTLTRLHIRVDAAGEVEDVVFKKADGLFGGLPTADVVDWSQGALESGAPDQFMSSYVIRNYWTGPVRCAAPTWGVFQAVNSGAVLAPSPNNGGASSATQTPLEELVRADVAPLGIQTVNPPPEPGSLASGCGCAAPGSGAAPVGGLALFVLGVFGARRARRERDA